MQLDVHHLFKALLEWIPERERAVKSKDGGAPAEDLTVDLPEAIPGIDLDVGLKNVGGNQRLYYKLLGDFRDDHAGDPESIGAALDLGDATTAKRIAHTIKGIAGTIGALDLQRVAVELEDVLKDPEQETWHSRLARLESVMAPLMNGLASLSAGNDSPEETGADEVPMDPERASRLLRELDVLLDEMDPDAEEKLAEFSTLVSGNVDVGLMRKLSSEVSGFDFEAARATLLDVRSVLPHNS